MTTTTMTVGWVASAAFLIGFLVRAIKTDLLKKVLSNLGLPPIPKRALPWVALVLGLASSILDHRMMGTDWPDAMVKGFVAAVTAIGGHELGVESLRKGKELLVATMILAFGTTSCAIFTRNAKSALDAVQIACVFGSELVEEEAVADACGIARELIPVVRNLIGQREAARRSGVRWGGTVDAADAGSP